MGKARSFVKKVMYAVGANFLSLFVSLLTTLIVPKFLGVEVEQYGYLQIYLFYTSYIGFFHFGWCDGIFLRDGGKKYAELDKPVYSAQFWLLTIVQVILALVIMIGGMLFGGGAEYRTICFAIAVSLIIFIPRTMLSYYLQATNRIKEYASITTVGRIIYGISIIATVLLCNPRYEYFVWGDVFGKFCALLVSVWWCRDIVFSKPANLIVSVKEAFKNISIGSKLMFANIASMLITGVVNWGIQQVWSVETYGRISFTLNVSNLLLTFISAVALVLYPTLRRTEQERLPAIYTKMRNALMIPMLGFLVLYYPAELILSAWLPQYAESMRYMAILFPMCIYAAQMTLLIQTYMNVFRLEKKILVVNIIGVAFAIVTTLISVFWMKNLTLAMLSVVLNQMFRCIYAEIVLSKHIGVTVIRDICLETVMTVMFICANWLVGGWLGVCIYMIGYLAYLCIKHRDIKNLISFFKMEKEESVA